MPLRKTIDHRIRRNKGEGTCTIIPNGQFVSNYQVTCILYDSIYQPVRFRIIIAMKKKKQRGKEIKKLGRSNRVEREKTRMKITGKKI